MKKVQKIIKNPKVKITHIYKFAPPHDGGIESVMTQFFVSTKDEYDLEVLSCSNKFKSSTEDGIKNIRCPYFLECSGLFRFNTLPH